MGKMAYYKFCFGKQSSVQTIVGRRWGGAALKAPAAPFEQQHLCSWRQTITGGGGRGKASFFYLVSFAKLN